jgi:serine/threonine protein phosphatase PrpC
LQAHDSLDCAASLIEAANDAGGKDNISVILVRASGGASGDALVVAVQALTAGRPPGAEEAAAP